MWISKDHRFFYFLLTGLLGICLLGFAQDFEKIPIQTIKIWINVGVVNDGP